MRQGGDATVKGGPGEGIALVVLMFLTMRVSALVMLQYGGLFGGSSDFDYYYQIGHLTDRGIWPYLGYWSEYPPLFPWLVTSLYRLVALAGGPPSAPLFATLLRAVLLPFDLGNLLLVYSLAHRLHGSSIALRCAWTYTALFSAFFIWLGWFEPLPVFLTLLGLKLLVDERWLRAGLAIGLGIAVKLIPGFLFLVALKVAWSREKPGAVVTRLLVLVAGTTATLAVIVVPLFLANATIFALSIRAWTSRLPWETPWAILDGYYDWGLVPSLATRVAWPTYFPDLAPGGLLAVASVACLVGALALLFVTGPAGDSALGRVALAGAMLTAIFATTTGFSPQFVDWVIPFAVILLPGIRGAIYASALTFLVLLGERYLYFWLFPPSPEPLAALVVARTAIFAVLVLDFLAVSRIVVPRGLVGGRALAWGVAVLGSVVLVGIGVYDYVALGWVARGMPDPAHRTYDLIRESVPPDAALVTFDLGTYERLAPWFGERAFFYLDQPYTTLPAQSTQAARDIAQAYSRIVTVDPQAAPSNAATTAEEWLKANGAETASEQLDTGYRVGVGSMRPPNP